MNTCFVMQPFDGGVYDKRYEDTFAPGIRQGGLEPYRVDRDPSVSVPIDDIQSGIRNALLCFAEITTDNPNVWFELGFAIAESKEVVLVCSEERRSHFPFDVQHRNIIKYRTGARQDFAELQTKIADRVSALLKKQTEIERASSIPPIKETDGLSQHEIVALVAVLQSQAISGRFIPVWSLKNDMNRAGLTDVAVSLALRLLTSKGMVVYLQSKDQNGKADRSLGITEKGEAWLIAHQDHLALKQEPEIPF